MRSPCANVAQSGRRKRAALQAARTRERLLRCKRGSQRPRLTQGSGHCASPLPGADRCWLFAPVKRDGCAGTAREMRRGVVELIYNTVEAKNR